MAEENHETLILGVKILSEVPFAVRPPLYWNKEKRDDGYHSIKWGKTDQGFRVKERTYVWGAPHEAQAGFSLRRAY